MAGESEDEDKTEEPTRRKLDEAHRKGDVPRSIEMSNFAAIGGGALAAFIFAGAAANELAGMLRVYLGGSHQWRAEGAAFAAVTQHAALAAFGALAVPLGLITLAALGGALAQHRPTWTVEPLAPKFERISPVAGAKRLFGKEAWLQFAKGLVKMGGVGAILGAILWSERARLPVFVSLETGAMSAALLALSLKLLGGVAAAMAVIAAADLVYQRYQWLTRHRMSRHELKEEFKETEGQPEVKQRRRQIARERLRRRMMAAVPKATVVITNPTHYAVALRFEPGMPAPVCVAKGVDELALRIRAVAREASVPLVENPPLARALHATVELDDEIPVEHYKAVAEVIGFVLRLSRRAA